MTWCSKLSFESKATAKAHVRKVAKAPKVTVKGGGGNRGMRPYQCERCGAWHLTSQTAREMRQIRRRMGL